MTYYDPGEPVGAVQYYYEEESNAASGTQQECSNGACVDEAAYEMTSYVWDGVATSPVQSTTTDTSSSYLPYDYDGEASRSDVTSETAESFIIVDAETPPPQLERQPQVIMRKNTAQPTSYAYGGHVTGPAPVQQSPKAPAKRGKKKRSGPYGVTFESREQLIRNRLAALPICDTNSMTCHVATCQRRFNSIQMLAFHMSYAHTDATGGPDTPLAYTCLICGSELTNARGKLAHMTSKHREMFRQHSESCMQQHAFSLRGAAGLLHNSRTVPRNRNTIAMMAETWTTMVAQPPQPQQPQSQPVMRRVAYTLELERSSTNSGQSSRSSSSLSSWPPMM